MAKGMGFHILLVLGTLGGITTAARSLSAAEAETPRQRRVLYNFDGDSCIYTAARSKGPTEVTSDSIRQLIAEVAYDGSQVDTILVCVNAQVMYYPTQAGTMRGMLSTPAERALWSAGEQQRFRNIESLFAQDSDPYAILLAEAKRRGREALLSFRINDDHGNDFLRTQFWVDHPEWRLGNGALDFGHEGVRDYVAGLIEEAVRRYDCDGIELDFNRFPRFFSAGTTAERVEKMNSLVARTREVLDQVGAQRGRRLTLAVRVPSNFGRALPTPTTAREIGCDVKSWQTHRWIDFVTVSEFLYQPPDLPIREWKQAIDSIPVYGGIECTTGGTKEQYLSAEKYRDAARQLLQQGADGVYLFNFFTTREYGAESWEPPFDVLRELVVTN